MTRMNLSSRAAATFMIASALLMTASGCNTQDPASGITKGDQGGVGKISANLTLPDGSILNSVSYVITGNGITPISGSIPVAQAGATIAAQIGGIPVGTGFLITLSGTTTTGVSTCAGSASFDIVAGATTQVTVAMQCRAAQTTGNARIAATINECPTLTAFSAQPLVQVVSSNVALSSAATDPEAASLTFTWSVTPAAAGTFADAHAHDTTFQCGLQGTATLTVSADDHAGCAATSTIQVNCTSAAVCGDSVVGPGEQCDDGNTVATDACIACRNAVCGDGHVQAGVEACDDGNTIPGDGCENNCTVTPGCGNGRIEGSETCDDGNKVAGDGCNSVCQIERCGNGVVDAHEVCDGTNGPTGPLGLGQQCNATCTAITDACRTCEVAQCTDFRGLGVDLIAGCFNNADPAAAQKCVDAVSCARVNKCAYTSRGAETCYCGSASSAQCQQGNGINGLCKSVFETAAGSTDPQVVTTHFGDLTLPIGNAVFMLQCDRDYCATTCVPAP